MKRWSVVVLYPYRITISPHSALNSYVNKGSQLKVSVTNTLFMRIYGKDLELLTKSPWMCHCGKWKETESFQKSNKVTSQNHFGEDTDTHCNDSAYSWYLTLTLLPCQHWPWTGSLLLLLLPSTRMSPLSRRGTIRGEAWYKETQMWSKYTIWA